MSNLLIYICMEVQVGCVFDSIISHYINLVYDVFTYTLY